MFGVLSQWFGVSRGVFTSYIGGDGRGLGGDSEGAEGFMSSRVTLKTDDLLETPKTLTWILHNT